MTAYDDGKDDSALRTIGEVSDALGIKPHVLRYWEAQFPLLKPLKRSGGRRRGFCLPSIRKMTGRGVSTHGTDLRRSAR